MAAKRVSPASPLGEKHIFENQTVKLGMFDIWKAHNQIDSRLVWLPIAFNADNTISIEWK